MDLKGGCINGILFSRQLTHSVIELDNIVLKGDIAVHIVRRITVGTPARAVETATAIQLAVKATEIVII